MIYFQIKPRQIVFDLMIDGGCVEDHHGVRMVVGGHCPWKAEDPLSFLYLLEWRTPVPARLHRRKRRITATRAHFGFFVVTSTGIPRYARRKSRCVL